jgi:hypothetical protein
MATDARIALDYIYDSYRSALLNRYYYGQKLKRYRFWNGVLDVLVAVGAAGSGITGLAVFTSDVGRQVLPWLLAASTVLGVAKPILNLGKAIETYAHLFTGHSGIFFDLRALVEDIAIRSQLPDDLLDRYSAVRRRAAELGGLHNGAEDRTLVRKLTDRVNAEIPPSKLWYPPE